jgi:hypothetical protein
LASFNSLSSAGNAARVFYNGFDRIIIDDAELTAVDFQAGA